MAGSKGQLWQQVAASAMHVHQGHTSIGDSSVRAKEGDGFKSCASQAWSYPFN